MARGRLFTNEEDQVIRLGIQRGEKIVEIAKWLGRTRQAIYLRISRMKDDGTIDQIDLDMGQGDG